MLMIKLILYSTYVMNTIYCGLILLELYYIIQKRKCSLANLLINKQFHRYENSLQIRLLANIKV